MLMCVVLVLKQNKVFDRVLNVYTSGKDPLHVLLCSKL